MNPLVSLLSGIAVVSLRVVTENVVTDRHSDGQTHLQTKYRKVCVFVLVVWVTPSFMVTLEGFLRMRNITLTFNLCLQTACKTWT
jgi:hypothetical protein